MSEPTKNGENWSFLIVGAVALVWHVMGCMNFMMQMSADSVAEMPEGYRAVIESRPRWATGAFALAMFGGLIGSVLLLLKKPASFIMFIVSLVGVIVHTLPIAGLPDVPTSIWVGMAVSTVLGGFLVWYSRYARTKVWTQ